MYWGLKSRPGIEVYRKSRTWREYHADSALVETTEHKYIIVGLARHKNGSRWLAVLVAPLHDLTVQHRILPGE